MVITLIGYRGSGKTTVGGQLAARLGWECVDSDTLIETQAGKSIAAIFSEDGEPRFRDLERNVLADLLTRDHLIVSSGGGAILDGSTRQRMQESGPVIWLQASPETLAERISADAGSAHHRPALSGSDAVSEVTSVLAQRTILYSETCSIKINTEHRTVTDIVDEIVSQLPSDLEAGW